MGFEAERGGRVGERSGPQATRRSALSWRTDFARENVGHFFVAPTRINTASPGSRLKHQQAASITRLRGGDLLVTCRWDEHGDSEGDATNEQALYESRDGGRTWRMANRGEPIVTLAAGTSFDRPSAITHSFVHEDAAGDLWLYYTINQPYTWGEGRPDRSTGGGEIRRVPLRRDANGEWRAGASQVVWAFMREIDDGAGGTWTDVRALCLNGILRLRSGRLLMPIAGRSTVPEPRGAFWPLDRSWVLASDDDGDSWTSHFMGGGPSLALCEPTLVETAQDDHVVAYLRSQYDTGFELYRSESHDGGHTWSAPVAAGLPNTRGSGVKPFITALSGGCYALLQTNEHDVTDRTNVSVFVTDEEGLRRNSWPLVKVVAAECREHWLGSAYGWLTEDPAGYLHAVWVSYTGQSNYLNHARLNWDWLGGTVIEPLAPADAHGDDLPRLVEHQHGKRALAFPTLRSRAHAPHLGALEGRPFHVSLRFQVGSSTGPFRLLDLRTMQGRHPWLRVELRPDDDPTSGDRGGPYGGHMQVQGEALSLRPGPHQLWVEGNGGAVDTGLRVSGEVCIEIEALSPTEALLRVNGHDLGRYRSVTARYPTILYVGGGTMSRDPCEFLLLEAVYGAATGVAGTGDGPGPRGGVGT